MAWKVHVHEASMDMLRLRMAGFIGAKTVRYWLRAHSVYGQVRLQSSNARPSQDKIVERSLH
jgi:hypothetical protein